MTLEKFKESGEELKRKFSISDDMQGYFRGHAPRLHRTAEMFGLFSARLGDVLEIGPFYGYMPFILRSQASSYTVLEGDDPVIRPLEAVYKERSVRLCFVDFGEIFGPLRSAT